MKTSLIHDVSDTAFMVAIYRMMESQRPQPLFRDPLAERLAGERGKQIVENLPKNAFMFAWHVIIRTRVIDDLIKDAIADGVDTIVNLGAGLDTRPYRMDLPAHLHWVEVDYPKIIELKNRELAGEKPQCRLERIPLDLADDAARKELFVSIGRQPQKALILTEGVIPYLSNEQVAALARDLLLQKSFQYWMVDYFSPLTYKFRKQSDVKKALEHAPFLFEPKNFFLFFADLGWEPQDIRYLPEESEKLKRPLPLPLLLKIFLKIVSFLAPQQRRLELKRIMGYVLLKRAE